MFIYCIEDINDLKYVGKTKQDLNRRFLDHKSKKDCSSSKLHLEHSIIYLLEECEEDLSKEREKYWINKLQSVNVYKLDKNKKSYLNKYNLERYHKNKEKINSRRKELRKLKKQQSKIKSTE